ncbi:hypothetical protein ABH931_007945 [Streptacidiphilus sp. MAP12-33]|uniref:ATP-binding protein n=1 Tax=Streptacidiphilus sp. MAP12-33 TaxID=3156266 RepID=UPI0035121DBD
MTGREARPETGRRTAHQVRRLRLGGPSGVVGAARDFSRGVVTEWGWADWAGPDAQEAVEDVLLVVSELVSNAVVHGGGAVELVLDIDPTRLVVGVSDLSHVRPAARESEDPARPGGHGLLVVRRLSARWGTTPLPDGKFVWAEFDAV